MELEYFFQIIKQWLLDFLDATDLFLGNKLMFMTCFWSAWKGQNIKIEEFNALLTEIRDSDFPIFKEFELYEVLNKRGI